MKIYEEILGNIFTDEYWKKQLADCEIEHIRLDQWTAQKSRFLARGDKGGEYPVALKRHSQITDGDILLFDPQKMSAAVISIELNPVLAVDLSALKGASDETVIERAFELGHAFGNQHWPAVIKGCKVYAPLIVDKKVMLSVMQTHRIEGISYRLQDSSEVIPYLAPHEIRRLFAAAAQTDGHRHFD